MRRLLGASPVRATALILMVMVSSCSAQDLGKRTSKTPTTTAPTDSTAQTFQWDGEKDFDQTGKVIIE